MNRIFLALTVSVFFLSGCSYPIVDHPLVTPSECKPCPELHGLFKTVNPDNKRIGYLHIGSAGKNFPRGFLKIIVVRQPEDKKLPLRAAGFVAFAEPIADSYVVHIPLPKDSNLEQQLDELGHKWDVKKIGYYALIRLTKTKTGFELFLMDENFIAAQIESKKLSGRVEQEVNDTTNRPTIGKRTIRITAETSEIRKYFGSTQLDKIFENDAIKYDALK